MKAKEFLRQIKKLDKIIQNKMIEAQQWRDLAVSTTSVLSPDKVQSTSNPQKMADYVARYVDLESEITQDIDRLIETKRDVIRLIEQLNATEYDVLHKFYVQYLTFDEIAYACNRSSSWATTVHGRALKHVQQLLDAEKCD